MATPTTDLSNPPPSDAKHEGPTREGPSKAMIVFSPLILILFIGVLWLFATKAGNSDTKAAIENLAGEVKSARSVSSAAGKDAQTAKQGVAALTTAINSINVRDGIQDTLIAKAQATAEKAVAEAKKARQNATVALKRIKALEDNEQKERTAPLVSAPQPTTPATPQSSVRFWGWQHPRSSDSSPLTCYTDRKIQDKPANCSWVIIQDHLIGETESQWRARAGRKEGIVGTDKQL